MTVVLLVDNQPLVGEAVRRMLAPYADIAYHYCSHPASAFDTTLEVKPTVVLLDMVMGDFDGLDADQTVPQHAFDCGAATRRALGSRRCEAQGRGVRGQARTTTS